MPPISGAGKIPETMWRAAKKQDPNISTAVSISWDWIHYLMENDTVDYAFRGNEDDAAVAKNMASFITNHQPNLMFIHFDSIDDAGHAHGWGSADYYAAARNVDSYIGTLFDALTNANILDKTLIILTADHGGYRFSHGSFNEACMYIPAYFLGPQIGTRKLQHFISDRDFAPTALHALGLQPGEFMQGRVVSEIFQT